MKVHCRLRSFLFIASSSLLSISRIHAANGTWLGNDGNWNATGTWSGGIIADGIGFTANFTGIDITANRTITLAADRTIGNISFTDLTTASNNLLITGANILTLDVSTGVPSIAVGNQTLTINSVIAGNEGFQKTSTGTLTLSGNNTLTGTVTVAASGGVIVANHNNALGSGTVALAGQAATLELANGITVANTMTVAAFGNGKILRLQAGATSATYAGNIVNSEEVGSNFDLGASTGGTLTISGIISSGISTAGLEKISAGTVTLTAANTYTGGTTITAGTLSLGSGGTTGRLTATTAIATVAAGNLTINRSDAFSQATDLGAGVLISGAGSFTQAGAGTTTLTAANTYTGTTTIKNGTLALDGAANRLAVAGAVVLGDTGTAGKLVLGGTTTASQTVTALTTTGSGGSVVGGNAANSTLTLNIASSNTFAGTLGGAGTNENKLALSKTGAGTLTLSNTANTFTGQVLSDSGTIQVTKLENNGTASSIGSGADSIRLGNNATATLEHIGTTDSSTNKAIQIGTNTATNTGNATILNNSTTGKLTFTAATFNQAPSVTVARALTLGGSYTGAANEIQGIIRDNNTAGGGIVSLTKEGVSTWALSGANTYTGATNVTGGVLAVNGSLANTTTTVGTGATLQGSGSISGSVTVQGGGTLATGNSIESLTTGALSLQALSTFAYEINNDAAAIVAGDLTAVTGNLTLDLGNTAILTLTDLGSGSWSAGEKLTLISYSGVWNNGLFNYASSTLANGSTFTFSGMEWAFNYNDTVAGTNYTGDLTGSNFVTMTAVPEPNVAALLGGLAAFALLRRRR
jgi:autotransporter-associated beta strand protein